MAAQDSIHGAVKNALIKDGWTITADPFKIAFGGVGLSADIGAEKVFAAEKGAKRIVVEIKSFLGPSPIHDLQQALGQFEMYRLFVGLTEPERTVFMAIDTETHISLFHREGIKVLAEHTKLKLLIVNLETEEVTQWIE